MESRIDRRCENTDRPSGVLNVGAMYCRLKIRRCLTIMHLHVECHVFDDQKKLIWLY